MAWDPAEEQYEVDDAYLQGARVTTLLLRYIVRQELYRLGMISEEQVRELESRLTLE